MRTRTNYFVASVFRAASENHIYDEHLRKEYRKLSDYLMFCVSAFNLFQNPNNQYKIAGMQCRHRLCSVCASIRAGKYANKVAAMFHLFKNPHFITITYGQRQQSLAVAAKDMQRRFVNLRGLKDRVPGTKNRYTPRWWRTYVRGGIASLEATYREGEGWHVHYHILVDIVPGVTAVNTTGDQYQYVTPLKQALEADLQTVGLGTICDIRPCDVTSARELSKYIVKFVEIDSPQAILDAHGLKGFRQIQPFGTMFGKLKDEDLDQKTHEWRFLGRLRDVLRDAWSGLSPPGQDIIDLTTRAMQMGIIGKVQLNQEVTA